MKLTLIAALSRNRVIGAGNRLPWHIPEDLARFKKLTLDHTLIMGRKTFDSIGKPLPRRRIIVVTRGNPALPQGVLVAHSIDDALDLARGEDEVFIAGGGEIYTQTIGRAHRLALTLVDAVFEGDAFFPEVDRSLWREVERQDRPAGTLPYSYSFVTYERAPAGAVA